MTELPTFLRPPVEEVVFGVHFEPLPNLTSPHVGLLWQEFRDRFPKLEQHGAIVPTIERQGLTKAGPQVQFSVSPAPVDFRIWMLSEDSHNILQLQPNFFLRNWRRLGGDVTEYPSYATLLPEFRSDYKTFLKFASQQDLGEVIANQCELTYVNRIRAGDVWSDHTEIAKALSLFGEYDDQLGLRQFDTTNANFSRAILSSNGEFVGRLHVSVATQFTAPNPESIEDRVINLTLVARGRPSSPELPGVESYFDIAHTQIVKTFEAITTSDMHKKWEIVYEPS